MKIGLTLNYSGDFKEAADHVVELEKVGADIVLMPEAYSYDAVSQLGYLAAKTNTIELGSGVFPIYTRTPTLLAMTAAGLDYVSDGRFQLGIGTSGPQVIEGFHGLPFDGPLGRTREVVEICRQVWRRERVNHNGKHYQVPLPAERGTGLGKPLQLINHPVRERIPISIAALGPKNVELTAEIAEGWQPIFFYPEKAKAVWGEALDAGRAKRDPALGPLEVWRARRWRSVTTSTTGWNGSNRNWRCTSAEWAPRAATSTTTWPPVTGSARSPTASRSCTCPGTSETPLPPFPKNWCGRSRWSGRAASSPSAGGVRRSRCDNPSRDTGQLGPPRIGALRRAVARTPAQLNLCITAPLEAVGLRRSRTVSIRLAAVPPPARAGPPEAGRSAAARPARRRLRLLQAGFRRAAVRAPRGRRCRPQRSALIGGGFVGIGCVCVEGLVIKQRIAGARGIAEPAGQRADQAADTVDDASNDSPDAASDTTKTAQTACTR